MINKRKGDELVLTTHAIELKSHLRFHRLIPDSTDRAAHRGHAAHRHHHSRKYEFHSETP